MKKKLNKKIATALIAGQIIGASSMIYAQPDEVLTNTVIKKWDYHKTNYDSEGNIRIQPETVLFDTENEKKPVVGKNLPWISISDTKYGEDVVISFDYGNDNARQWQENISRVTRKSDYSSDNPNLETDVEFKIENGKLILDSQSRAIDFNAEHRIKIYSDGYPAKEVPVNIVEKGKIKIHPDFRPVEGLDLVFVLEDFNYRIKNPVYAVYLDGKELEGGCEEYHVVSNVIRLENKSLEKLTRGRHTVVVKAKGYEDFEKTFEVIEDDGTYGHPPVSHEAEIKLVPDFKKESQKEEVDSVSGASKKKDESDEDGNSSQVDSVSGASASPDQRANLVFDFDLVSNAKILEKIGKETENSKRVVKLWNSVEKDAAIKDGVNRIVSWDGYTNAVLDAQVKGEHVTFEKYIADPNAEDYENRPYNVKYVLEDGAYGDVQPFRNMSLKDFPSTTVNDVVLGHDIEIAFKDSKWADRIKSIKSGPNVLSKGEYSIEDGKIKINTSKITSGKNYITIESKGYKAKTIEVFVKRAQIELSMDSENAIGQNINITGVTGDYASNIKSVSLNGKQLFVHGQLGSQEWDYKLQSDKIVINKKFAKEGQLVVQIKSDGYEDKILKFKLEDKEIEQVNPVEDVLPAVKASQGIVGQDAVIAIEKDNSKWRSSVKGMEINNVPVSGDKYSIGADSIIIDGSKLRKGRNRIIIKSENYLDLPIDQEMISQTPEVKVEKANVKEGLKLSVDPSSWVWVDDVSQVRVDGKAIEDYEKSASYIEIGTGIINKAKTYRIEVDSKDYETWSKDIEVKLETEKKAVEEDEDKDQNSGINISIGEKEKEYVLPNLDHIKHINRNENLVLGMGEWTDAISEISVNGKVLSQGMYYENTSNAQFIIKSDVFESTGQTEMVFKAENYENLRISFMVKPGYEVPSELKISDTDIMVEEDVEVDLSSIPFTMDAYRISSVYLNGNKIDDEKLSISFAKVVIKAENFDKEGVYSIKLRADKYKDKEFDVKVSGKEAPKMEYDAPVLQGDSTDNKLGMDIEVSFESESGWINNISRIRINGKLLSDNEMNKVQKSDGAIEFAANLFEEAGTYDIEIESEGFKTASVSQEILEEKKVEKEEEEKEQNTNTGEEQKGDDEKGKVEEELKAAPEVEEGVYGMLKTDFAVSDFSAEWKENIKSVKVNGSEANSDFWTIEEDLFMKGRYNFKINNKSIFTEKKNVFEIESKGFENCTFNIQNGY